MAYTHRHTEFDKFDSYQLQRTFQTYPNSKRVESVSTSTSGGARTYQRGNMHNWCWTVDCLSSSPFPSMGISSAICDCDCCIHTPQSWNTIAKDRIYKGIQRHSLSPDAPCWMMGDFSNCKLKKCLNLHQYVTSPTRKDKTLDLCFCSIKEHIKI